MASVARRKSHRAFISTGRIHLPRHRSDDRKERLANRAEKIDNHVYDASAFQIALAERYRMPEVTEPLTSRGTRLIVMDGSGTREELAEKMRQTLTSFTGKI